MKEIIRLTKLFVTTNFGLSVLGYNRKYDRRAFLKQAGTGAAIVVVLIPAFALYIVYMAMLYSGLSMINQTSVFLPVVFTFVSLMIVIFGIAYVLSEFYFSKGVQMLLTLPIKPKNIIIGKFTSVMVIECFLSFMLMMPTVIIYGIGQNMGILYYLLSLIVVIMLPILPIAIETLLMMLVMRSASLIGKKDVIQIVMLFLFIVTILGGEMYLSSSGMLNSNDPMAFVSGFLTDNGMLLRTIISIYPISLFIANGLNTITLLGFLNILALFAITAVAFFLMVWVGERVYIKGLLSQNENRKKSVEMSEEKVGKALGKKTPSALAVFKMDMRLLLRTPIFLFNNVSVIIIVPICIFMAFTMAGTNGEFSWSILKEIYQQFPDGFNLVFVAFFMFYGGMTATTPTTFSREGKKIWLTQIIPVSAKDQIIGRCLTGLCIQVSGSLLTMGMICFFVPLSVTTLFITLVFGTLGSIPILIFGLLIDMSRPLLDWDNPQRAVKNNMNFIISMLVSMVYMMLILTAVGVIGFFLMPVAGYLVFIIFSLVLSSVLYNLVAKRLEQALLIMSV
ncbi:MAG: hypothetical protein RR310_00745 [Eubacterium sp.]